VAIQITVNGKEYSIDAGSSIDDFLAEHCPQKEWVAIALNMKIIPKEAYAKTCFEEGDKMNIVQPVAGG